jgi:hypothetical protein
MVSRTPEIISCRSANLSAVGQWPHGAWRRLRLSSLRGRFGAGDGPASSVQGRDLVRQNAESGEAKAARVLALPEEPGTVVHVENKVAGHNVLLQDEPARIELGSRLKKCCIATSLATHQTADQSSQYA